jgi:hypothetical protein
MLSLTKRTLIDHLPGATALGTVLSAIIDPANSLGPFHVKGDAQLLFHVPFNFLTLGETARAVSVTQALRFLVLQHD